MENYDKIGKPRRPFGLTLAMIAAVMLFTLLPLIEVLFVFAMNEVLVPLEAGGMIGGSVIGFNLRPLLVQMGVSLAFLFLTLVAARGKIAAMGWLYPLAVVVVGTGFLLLRVLPAPEGIDSLTAVRQTLVSCGFWLIVGLMLFTVWFCRRWSVQAFYRGYYTDQDVATMQHLGFLGEENA